MDQNGHNMGCGLGCLCSVMKQVDEVTRVRERKRRKGTETTK